MDFILTSSKIKQKNVQLLYEDQALKGVVRILNRIADDIKEVFGIRPEVTTIDNQDDNKLQIIVATMGNSKIIKKLDTEDIKNKREVYKLIVDGKNKESKLYILGSDKRGTIYGMFEFSRKLGVSPFIDWLDAKPERIKEFKLKENFIETSKEPSVKYRGFFINDEWPAFGNFCKRNYGGFNAKVYGHIFELLLRLKGNYMWPAMWSAIFPNDGPGLENCELADELGVVMGMSHHEPCLRQGEEYKYLRGKDSIYGDAWNFITNREGITRFWEDGLKRSGKYENVITVGMRGEADTKIMENATLKDNIDLLRDVLKTQNKLIKKYVNKNLDEVPRMLALYKEVEPYFYGDDTTEGLMGDKELDGVTLMLCDDNFGNLRTVPTEEMRSHKGGYGMYYHFDYHGLPISFEWFNTSFLTKVWEQMTAAYDFGIRDLWIVNVGDVFSNEYPLAYFLDLAYDFDKWGTNNINSVSEFNSKFCKEELGDKKIAELLRGYTKITSRRRTEAMSADIYAPFAYNECEDLLKEIFKLEKKTKAIYEDLKSKKSNKEFVFYELCYLPLIANLNVQKMWAYTTLNHGYASFGSTYALKLAEKIQECIDFDRKIVDELHSIKNHKWYGMGMSEHIGFKYWCEEECQYPIVQTFEPANKNRLIVNIPGTNQHTEGRVWTGRILTLGAFLEPKLDAYDKAITLSTAGKGTAFFEVTTDSDGIEVIPREGRVTYKSLTSLKVKIDRNKMNGKVGKITIKSGESTIEVRVPVPASSIEETKNTFLWCAENNIDLGKVVTGTPSYTRVLPEGTLLNHYISIEAEHYFEASEEFKVIPDYGRTLSALKAYPQEKTYKLDKKAPYVAYRFEVPSAGEYEVELYTNPSNPCGRENILDIGMSVNDSKIKRIALIPDGFTVGDGNMHWQLGVLDNIRKTKVKVNLEAGINVLKIHAASPNLVLEKLVIYDPQTPPTRSYLGPTETYRVE